MKTSKENIFDPLYCELCQSEYRVPMLAFLDTVDCDIDHTFLGFTDIYASLSKIIPLHFRVIDLGCGYGFQSWYFRNHRAYVAVDLQPDVLMCCKNASFHHCSTVDYLANNYIPEECEFAICSYVPPWGNCDSITLARMKFKNVFTYYPEGDPRGIFKKMASITRKTP